MPRLGQHLLAVVAALPLAGCATMQALAQLPQVQFHLDRTTGATLAGIDLDRLRNPDDLGPADLLTVAVASRGGRLPLRFDLHVGAENPSASQIDLRLERLEWTLLLEDHETVSGVVDGGFVLAPDGVTDVPIAIELDLLRFFREDAASIARLAVRSVGGGRTTNLKLRARPTLLTPLGPVRFPSAITILSRDL